MALDTTAGREAQAKESGPGFSAPELMVYAQKKSGRGPLKLGREFMRLQKGNGKLTLAEYVRYELYDSTTFSPEDKARFLGNAVHWPLVSEICDRTWDAATEDKWLSGLVLEANGCRVPETVAVVDAGPRHYGAIPKLGTADALCDFLNQADLPLFGKALRGICSFGAFIVTGADRTHIHFQGQAPVTYSAFLDDFMEGKPYVLQRVINNHESLHAFTNATATVRLVTMIRDDEVVIPFAALKLPGGSNIADAFWRPGNVACAVDPVTGIIRTITTQTPPGLERHDAHPVTGSALIGEALPDWRALIEMGHRAAMSFADVCYQSLDVAMTPDGPMIVEINTGGGWDLIQNTHGTGFLTDEIRDFFRSKGSRRI